MVEMEEVAVVVVVFERKGLPQAEIFLGTFFGSPFPTIPSPLKLVLVSISSWFDDFFFFIFLVDVGDAGDADGAGVVEVADVFEFIGVSGTFGEAAVFLVAVIAGAFVEVNAGVADDSAVTAAGGGALVCFWRGDEIGLFPLV